MICCNDWPTRNNVRKSFEAVISTFQHQNLGQGVCKNCWKNLKFVIRSRILQRNGKYLSVSTDDENLIGCDHLEIENSKRRTVDDKSHTLQIQIDMLNSENNKAKKRLKEYEDEIDTLSREKSNAINELKSSTEVIAALKKEKEDVLSRLSELMGAKLRDNNPAITDLNDPNRPMKLGEQFSEMYENEWTDSFMLLNGQLGLPEKEAIGILITILREMYDFSQHSFSQQITVHKQIVDGVGEDEIRDYMKKVKDFIKSQSSAYIPLLVKKMKDMNDTTNYPKTVQYKPHCLSYIQACIRICYLAVIQDPHVCLDFDPQSTFQKSLFKEYTKSGTKLDYIVWPAMFLHEGGPLLCKGVVQPL